MTKKKIKIYKEKLYYEATLIIEVGKLTLHSETYNIEKVGDFFFINLLEIRKELEKDGAFLLINGNRKDVYPSGMSLIGSKAYIQVMGKASGFADLVDIFEETDRIDLIATVEDQKKYHDEWLTSIT